MVGIKRTGSYPIQSSEYTPHNGEHPEAEDTPPLPAAIRAVKDSREPIDHSRTIVVCLDGTGDEFDNDNSNVVHFVSCLKKHESTSQVTYYQSGIGTYGKSGPERGFGAAMDMAVGSGLGIHVRDAYKFLMQNYRDGDRICLLGFSRGAYTVRCLAGMLHKVGLLPGSNGAQVPFAYKFYKDDSPEGWKLSAEFKKAFCTTVDIYFLGVWDCVASVGVIPRQLPFTQSPTKSIHYFRHAMALDEHRAKFKVCQWQEQENPDFEDHNAKDYTSKMHMHKGTKHSGLLEFDADGKARISRPNDTKLDESNALMNGTSNIHGTDRSSTTNSQKKLDFTVEAHDTSRKEHQNAQADVLEVWFMGAHADVGGGAVANETRHMLSRIPFRWMVRQCFECNTGILFNTTRLAEHGLDVYSLWPKYQPPSIPALGPPPSVLERYEAGMEPSLQRRSLLLTDQSSMDAAKSAISSQDKSSQELAFLAESNEDHLDALSPINDQLVQAKGWWILELWPIKVHLLEPDGETWIEKVRMNLGRHRSIRQTEPKMHWTVRHMINEGRYTVRGRTDRNTTWQVVA